MVCTCCGKDMSSSDFYRESRKKNGLMSRCKECVKKKNRDYYHNNIDKVGEYHRQYNIEHREQKSKADALYRNMVQQLKTPCVKCGETRLYVLDFHHIDPSQKAFNINRKTAKKNFEVIQREVQKCVCLCRNCHMEFHYFYGLKPQFPIEALSEYLGKEVNING